MKTLLLLATSLSFTSVHAAVTTEHLWSFNEVAVPTGDSGSTGGITLTGEAAHVSFSNANPISAGSPGYVTMDGAAYSGLWQTGSGVSLASDNFGVEFWIRTEDVTQGGTQKNIFLTAAVNNALSITYNDGGLGGFTISRNGVAYVYQNFGYLPDTDWHDFAVVSIDGKTSVYLDGVLLLAAAPATYAEGISNIHLGTPPGGASRNFAGALDEVRYFTFAPGAFDAANDLYTVIPEPSTYALGLAGIGLAALAIRRRKIR